ncbi:uncharacterized protein NECHADRAFT_88828 [Fusarium vanettenii 77-13-4]|uniref:Uncharacterized protein n=1 Tax=Fusarium vanettenii (strain ATCC MYA-4622 / CBS 123669 / FGSC 9596 / NRRL 45880 / 77-13-4) TaxID=660122 RepID=C7ZN70_FUSV7|nr:uncharacterized protein NECHADRAFT_88828 [Fusarium vanettenii 77-13-4]EEU34534.1 predicted protein [Fusarium vanettenii 77-13-4]
MPTTREIHRGQHIPLVFKQDSSILSRPSLESTSGSPPLSPLGIDEELAETPRSRSLVVSGESALDAINTAASDVVPAGQDLDRIELANSVAEISDNRASLIKIADKDDNVSSVADLASAYRNPCIIVESLLDDTEGLEVARGLSHKLYIAEPATVLVGMVDNNNVISANDEVKQGVASFMRAKVPGVDVLVTLVLEALEKMTKLFGDVSDVTREAIVDEGHTMRRVNALPPDWSKVTALLSTNMKYCTDIAMKSVAFFQKSAIGVNMSSQQARQVHSAAVNMAMMYSNSMASAFQVERRCGLFMDGCKSHVGSPVDIEKFTGRQQLQVNFDTIFGGNDETISKEWGTIYGPAAYFVSNTPRGNHISLTPMTLRPKWTALMVLDQKRPDSALYELTEEDVTTLHIKGHDKLELAAFSVQKATVVDLLWRPENTNIMAYGYDAGRLGLTEEEYLMLTNEVFQSPSYYHSKVAMQYGISPVHEPFGYKTSSGLHDKSPNGNGRSC